MYLFIFQANALACQGKYTAGSIKSSAGEQGLYVKNHVY